MLVLITGGSGSGKSEFAENLAVQLGGKLTYIAAMKPSADAECQTRIARHRKMRLGKGFDIVERYTDIKNLYVNGTAVLECMSNLLANEMFGGSGENAVSEILLGIEHVKNKCDNLIIVTNEISSDGMEYDTCTQEYKKNLGHINCEIAKTADEVYEVVCGAANKLKG